MQKKRRLSMTYVYVSLIPKQIRLSSKIHAQSRLRLGM